MTKNGANYRTSKSPFNEGRYFDSDPGVAIKQCQAEVYAWANPVDGLSLMEEIPFEHTLRGAVAQWLVMREKVRRKSDKSEANVILQEAPVDGRGVSILDVSMEHVTKQEWIQLEKAIECRRTAKTGRQYIHSIVQWCFEFFEIQKQKKLVHPFGMFATRGLRDNISAERRITRKVFGINEVRALLREADPMSQAMILWIANGAFDILDTCLLSWHGTETQNTQNFGQLREGRDLFVGKRRKRQEKQDGKRAFWIWPETLAAISRLERSESGLVFPSPNGGPWKTADNNSSRWNEVFNAVQDKAGVRVKLRGPRGLRHTFSHYTDLSQDVKGERVKSWVMGHTTGIKFRYNGKEHDVPLRRVGNELRVRLFLGAEAWEETAGIDPLSVDGKAAKLSSALDLDLVLQGDVLDWNDPADE